jgi:hypothetical protein
MGVNHGHGNPSGNWRVISETFAFRWHDRRLACRFIEHTPGHSFDQPRELRKDREEEHRGEIEAIMDDKNMTPLEPPLEDETGPQERIAALDHADDRPLMQDVVDQPCPTPTVLDTKPTGSETEAQRPRGMRAVLGVATRARGLITAVRNYVGSFANRLNK